MKEDILEFLEWAENKRKVSLCNLEGCGVNFYTSYEEIDKLVDEFIEEQEEE